MQQRDSYMNTPVYILNFDKGYFKNTRAVCTHSARAPERYLRCAAASAQKVLANGGGKRACDARRVLHNLAVGANCLL